MSIGAKLCHIFLKSQSRRLAKRSKKGAILDTHNVHKARRGLDATGRLANFPSDVQKEKTMVGEQLAYWLTPRNPIQDKALLFLHGGGYCVGSFKSHGHFAARMAKMTGRKVLFLEYGLAPEKPFPQGIYDAVEGYQFLINQGFSAQNIIIAGDSAGGGLSVSCCLELKKRQIEQPEALYLISPWVDFTLAGESIATRADKDPYISESGLRQFRNCYLAQKPEELKHEASPLFGDLKNMPRTLIQVGDNEVLLDDANRLAERMKAAGNQVELSVWEGMFHDFQLFSRIVPEAKKAIREATHFIQR